MKRTIKIFIIIVISVLLTSCNFNAPLTGDLPPPVNGAFFMGDTPAAADGMSHEPYGADRLYGAKEAPVEWWQRTPSEPQEGEEISVTAALWRKDSPEIYVEWTLNGKEQPHIDMSKNAILEDSGLQKEKYTAKLGSFKQGDVIEYIIIAAKNDEINAQLGPYSFTVSKWETVDELLGAKESENGTQLFLKTKSLTPSLVLSAHSKNGIKAVINPLNGEVEKGGISSQINIGGVSLNIGSAPFAITLSARGKKAAARSDTSFMQILTDGKNVSGVRMSFKAEKNDGFYGFGMKYDSLNQRGKNVDTYCVNWYTDQIGQTYTPVPFYFVPNKYGFFANSTYYSRFEIDTKKKDICQIDIKCRNDDIEFYMFTGSKEEISNAYTEASGKPVLPPVWAFGPWISANEWDTQAEIMQQMELAEKHKISTSVIVIEAWSDEETFYTFNDSEFKTQDGSHMPKLSDFTFKGRWPSPKQMADEIHEAGAKILLWQIPVLKASANETPQSRADKEYAKEQGFVLKNENGTAYRLPGGTWFGNSYLIDFTSDKASEWFLSKRKYLLDEIGIDGFKTDGGEFVWGRGTIASNGMKGDELRNLYPDLYAQSFFDYSRKLNPEAITFSRAGGASMQNHPICWIGDQKSTQKAYEDALRATLSASMSGIPFVAWDIAGFSGDVPTSELYQRAVAQAAFSPIMQVHSETSGDPTLSQARTPWNMAQRKGSPDCLETYRYFANVRMNLMPYIYTEARHASKTGEPMMRCMAYAFPQDEIARAYEFQYMFGRELLVAPVMDLTRGKTKIYLPNGKWHGLFDGKEYSGGVYNLTVPMNTIPVFIRDGAAIPLNLDNSMSLGSYVGNNPEIIKNLSVVNYSQSGKYTMYDYVNQKEIEISTSKKGIARID